MDETRQPKGQSYDVTVTESISATDDYDFGGAVIKTGVYETISIRTALSATAVLHTSVTESLVEKETLNAIGITGSHVTESASVTETISASVTFRVIEFTTESDTFSALVTHNGRMVEIFSGIEMYGASVVHNVDVAESITMVEDLNYLPDIVDTLNPVDTTSITHIVSSTPPSIPTDEWMELYPPATPYPGSPAHVRNYAQDQKRILQYTYRVKPGPLTGR